MGLIPTFCLYLLKCRCRTIIGRNIIPPEIIEAIKNGDVETLAPIFAAAIANPLPGDEIVIGAGITVAALIALLLVIDKVEVDIDVDIRPNNAKRTCRIRCTYSGPQACSTNFIITYPVNHCNKCPLTSTNHECDADTRGIQARTGGCQPKHHQATCS